VAWLLVLTRRSALNHLRSSRRDAARRSARVVDAGEVPPAPAGPREDLQRAMEGLPRRLREVVILRHIAGLTFDQVALALGANRNTTAARYREAIRRLREMLEVNDVESLAGSST
jgi:RNA polymerase sigma-70 factor (ECF subfamily)